MTESPDLADLADYQAKDSQQALDAARSVVQSYCQWQIAPSATVTADVWSPDGRTICLPTLKLTAVTSLTQDGSAIAASSYIFESYGVIRAVDGYAFSTRSRIAVAFTHGYDVMPSDVADVILGLAQRSISDTRGMVPRAGSGKSVVVMENYGARLGDADKAKLAPYAIASGFA